MSSLEYWDKHVAPILRQIDEVATQIETRGRWLEEIVGTLPARPAWPTRAEVSLESAARQAEFAAKLLRRLQRRYVQSPILVDAAIHPEGV